MKVADIDCPDVTANMADRSEVPRAALGRAFTIAALSFVPEVAWQGLMRDGVFFRIERHRDWKRLTGDRYESRHAPVRRGRSKVRCDSSKRSSMLRRAETPGVGPKESDRTRKGNL
jgi:hypothetical protein